MSDRVIAGHFELVSATLISYSGTIRQALDAGIMYEFYIEESINADSLRGSAKLHDKIGILEKLPIRGEETLELVIKDILGIERTYLMSVYKVTNVNVTTTNDGYSYTIHFVSKSRFNASFRRITKAYNDTNTNIVKDIYDKYYKDNDNKKELISEDTFGTGKIIIPNYTPMQAMNFLASKSYSRNSASSSFRFFETYNNYYFISDEQLIRNATANPDNIQEFIFSEALDKSGQKDLNVELQNIMKMSYTDRINSLSDLLAGAYRSHTIEIDLIQKTVTLPTKGGGRSWKKNNTSNYVSVSGKKTNILNQSQEPHTQEFIDKFYTEENQRRYLVVKDYVQGYQSRQINTNQHLPEIAMNRTAYRHALMNTALDITINGRFDVNAGDIIKVIVPPFIFAPGDQEGLNNQLSGNYLVYGLVHSFIFDVHTIGLKIVKYDWDTE